MGLAGVFYFPGCRRLALYIFLGLFVDKGEQGYHPTQGCGYIEGCGWLSL